MSLIPRIPPCSRLAIILILQAVAVCGQVVSFFAPPCSTWISINLGTSKRSILCPAGDTTLLQNRKGNKTATRTGSLVKHALNFTMPYRQQDLSNFHDGIPVVLYWPWRLGLLCLLLGALDASFIIEQPGSSLFFAYPYIRAAFRKLRRAGLKAGVVHTQTWLHCCPFIALLRVGPLHWIGVSLNE